MRNTASLFPDYILSTPFFSLGFSFLSNRLVVRKFRMINMEGFLSVWSMCVGVDVFVCGCPGRWARRTFSTVVICIMDFY